MVRWLSGNWIWLVAVGGMLWMHLGMHGGHGGQTQTEGGDGEGGVAEGFEVHRRKIATNDTN